MNSNKKILVILNIISILTVVSGAIREDEKLIESKDILPSSGTNEDNFEYKIILENNIKTTDKIQLDVTAKQDDGTKLNIFNWERKDLSFSNNENKQFTKKFDLKRVEPFLGEIQNKLTVGGKTELFSGPYIEVNIKRFEKDQFYTHNGKTYFQVWLRADGPCNFFLNCTSHTGGIFELEKQEYSSGKWEKYTWVLDPKPKNIKIEYTKRTV